MYLVIKCHYTSPLQQNIITLDLLYHTPKDLMKRFDIRSSRQPNCDFIGMLQREFDVLLVFERLVLSYR